MSRLRSVTMRGDTADVFIDGVIGDETTAVSFREQLARVKGSKVLMVHINSEGGSVKEGMGIYNALRSFAGKKIGVVEGLAASMGSLILMACDERRVAKGAYVMIHSPMSEVAGNPDDLHKAADDLDKIRTDMLDIYEARTGMERGKLEKLLSAETYFSADEAVASGIADTVDGAEARITLDAVARLTDNQDKIPAALRARAKGKAMADEKMSDEDRKAQIAKYKGKIAELEALAEGDEDKPDEDKPAEDKAEEDDDKDARGEDDEKMEDDEKKEAKALASLVKSITGSKTIAGAAGKLAALISKGGADAKGERATAVDAAVKSGRLLPAMKAWALEATDKAWGAYVAGIGGESVLKLGKQHKEPTGSEKPGEAPVGDPTDAEWTVARATYGKAATKEQALLGRTLPACAQVGGKN